MRSRRNLCTILLMTLCAAAPAGGADSSPVIVYWNADRPSHGWRDSEWQKGGSGRTHFDTGEKRHGRAAMRIDGVADREVFVSSVSVHAHIAADTAYTARFWYRREGSEGHARFQVLGHSLIDERRSKPVGWVPLAGDPAYDLPVSPSWQQVALTLERFPAGTAKLFFYFRVKGDTKLWIDEFSLAEAGTDVPLGGEIALAENDYAGIRLPPEEAGTNLLLNPGFENGLEHWQIMGTGPDIAVTDQTARTGAKALHITAREFTAGGVFQRVRIDPRYTYRLSYHITCRDLTGYVFTKVLRFDRDNHPRGWLGGEILTTGTTDGWEERHGEFTPTPQTDNVVVYLRVADTIGDASLDDVKLEALPRE